ncbi:unnamed protein product [Lactuca saligna]|uniref:Uncharacterized protein n=1 Tax=Lactuca saligna TaxID=75948 RepID=A0AA35ULU4_LACSI|nr:unnamed protein product [Lactuca saligna]
MDQLNRYIALMRIEEVENENHFGSICRDLAHFLGYIHWTVPTELTRRILQDVETVSLTIPRMEKDISFHEAYTMRIHLKECIKRLDDNMLDIERFRRLPSQITTAIKEKRSIDLMNEKRAFALKYKRRLVTRKNWKIYGGLPIPINKRLFLVALQNQQRKGFHRRASLIGNAGRRQMVVVVRFRHHQQRFHPGSRRRISVKRSSVEPIKAPDWVSVPDDRNPPLKPLAQFVN